MSTTTRPPATTDTPPPAYASAAFRRPFTGRLRGGPREQLALALVAAVTTWVALLSWTGFAVNWGGFMGPLVTDALVVALSGAALRWLRVPGPLLVLVQVLVVGMVLSAQLTGSLVPLGEAWLRLEEVFADAMASARHFSAPVPRGAAPIDPILIAGGTACLWLVDLLACTLRRVPLAGLPLLTIYSIPVSLLGAGVSWVVFALTALGFLLMLFMQESRQIARWGRPLGGDPREADPSAFGVSNGALRTSGTTIGAVAVALAIVVPLFIPSLGLHIFEGGFGRGGGGDQIKIENPVADMTRDLRRGRDVPMLQVATDDPNPGYLRISVLNRYTGNEWSPGDRKVPTDQRAVGEMPPIQGLDAEVKRREYDYQVRVTDDFISTWLPTQAPISRIDAPGDWRYDVSTMDFIRGDDDLTTAGISYSMTAVVPELSAEKLAGSSPATSMQGTQFTETPGDLPPIVRQLATQITADLPTRFQKAVALQRFFREDGGFVYDLRSPAGSGNDTLERFLDASDPDGRRGYCEQFASAMAVMARTIGIPARVAIGFLRPDPLGDDNYVYSAHDLHAWPELYFPGSGWVRFEPTPAARASDVPRYTTVNLPVPNVSDTPTAAASSGDIGNRPELTEAPGPDASGASGGQTGVAALPWRGIGIGLVCLAVLGLLAATPRWVRRRRRNRRLHAEPEAVWEELRDTVVDLQLAWPRGRSPRETAGHLVQYFGPPAGTDPADRPRRGPGISPEAERGLDRIVTSLERLRYARPGQSAPALTADAETVIGALVGGCSPRARRRADWLPRSMIATRQRAGAAPAEGDLRVGSLVDHAG